MSWQFDEIGSCDYIGNRLARPVRIVTFRPYAAHMNLETWELLSYVVTVIGLPLAIAVFVYEQRKERENEEEEVYQLLSDNYQDFLRVTLEHPDLRLFSAQQTESLSEEQRERRLIIFSMLVSLLERAYLLLYAPEMTAMQQRRWASWEDYMREWCARPDFRAAVPGLIGGEDPDFVAYLQTLVRDTESASGNRSGPQAG